MTVIELRALLDVAITNGKGCYTVMHFEDARYFEELEVVKDRLPIDLMTID